MSENSADLQTIVNHLRSICSRIKNFTDNSEKEFLDIGSRLQTYLSASREVSAFSSEVMTSLSGENMQNGITELNLLLNKFSEYFSHSANEINSDKKELLSISESVESLIEKSEGFKKIVKHLRMLAISTKIESAVLGQSDNGFVALADNTDNLSGLINEKSALIKHKAVFLITEVAKTTEALDLLEAKQRKRASVILDKLSLSLGAFEKHLNKGFQKSQKITSGSDNVSKNIFDIVSSVQFHDITRQQLEHVVETTLGLADEMITKASDHEVNDDDYSLIHDICELQERQLCNTSREFYNAVTSIHNNLKSVAENMSGIFSESNDLFQNMENEDGSMKFIQKELQRISEGLNKNIEIENQLTESLKYVVTIVDDLSKVVLEIEDIGSEIELLALNALVKAAHTEINGSALGILAQEIKHLSIEAKKQTTTNSEILESIIQVSKKLRINMTSSDTFNETNTLLQINTEISENIDKLIITEDASAALICKMNVDIKSLKAEIESAASNITIHSKADDFFRDISSDFISITDGIKNNPGIVLNKKKNTSELMKNYSMQIERKIHQDYTTGNVWSDSDNSTLETGDDQFGENIELF